MTFCPCPKPEPRILRDAAIKREEEKAWRACKARVMKRDGKRCRLCGKLCAPDPHHILSRSRGGRDIDQNVIALCREHHDWVKPGLLRLVPLDPHRGADGLVQFTIDARVSKSGQEEQVTR